MVYYSMDALLPGGIDWSIEKALTWCQHKHWVNIKTKPLLSLVRITGIALGLALANNPPSGNYSSARRMTKKPSHTQAVLGACAGFVFSRLWMFINSKDVVTFLHYDLILFATHCSLGVMYVAFVIRFIPYILYMFRLDENK